MVSKGQVQKSKKLPQHLLEAFRDLGTGIGSDAYKQAGFSPWEKAEEKSWHDTETQTTGEKRLFQADIIQKQEKMLFSAKEQELKAKITALQVEVQKLASATQNLAKEAQVTTFQAPANPGIYHENFFEKIISFLKLLTKNVENASLWLASWNSRSKKRPYYWGQVKKSGSNFYLSQERYMSTQAG